MGIKSLFALLLMLLAGVIVPIPALASPSANAQASVRIVRPAGISLVQDILGQMSILLIISGRRGDALSLDTPDSVQFSGLAGEILSFKAPAHRRKRNTVLDRDLVSVAFAGPPGSFDKAHGNISIVLAQYN